MRRLLLILTLAFVTLPSLVEAQVLRPPFNRGFLHPQLARNQRGGSGLLWVKVTDNGHDLFLAKRQANGAMQDPVKVNSSDGDVLYVPDAEGRPGFAAGPTGVAGVSWFDTSGRLFVSVTRDGANTFSPAVEVGAGHTDGGHPYSDVAFNSSGTLFVSWIGAPNGTPDLFVARIDGDRNPVVQNMTADFDVTPCSGSRPDLFFSGSGLTVHFRVVGTDGFRDVHRIQTDANLRPGEPQRMGGALWNMSGCPRSGAVGTGEFSWFLDGSSGTPVFMEATSPNLAATPVRAATVVNPSTPRLIAGSERPSWMVYLPGQEFGQVLARQGGGWRVLLDQVPFFVSDIILLEGQLLMVGQQGGVLWMEARAVK
jgi:hypothetical protein